MVNITWTPGERQFIGLHMATQNTPFTRLPEVEPHCYETLMTRIRQKAYTIACENWQYLNCQGHLSAVPSRILQKLYSRALCEFDTKIQAKSIQLFAHRHMTIRRFLESTTDDVTPQAFLSLVTNQFGPDDNILASLPTPNLTETDFIHFYCYLSNKDRCFISWSDPPVFTNTCPTAPICFEQNFN
jgi:hypothetical protein